MAPIRFETDPSRYRHWRFGVEGSTARLALDVQENAGLRPGYELKLNSYDLGVDIELADAISRVRFEHPEVRVLVITSAKDRVFCSGANIYMLASSSHEFKVNFCKFTNETRIGLEELSRESGVPSIALLNGTASGGGYELALASDHVLLQDDGNSAVSLPELPLLGVLPGTGGLTRLVDKRKVRRDRADVFSTLAEGIRGKRALDWGLVDELAPKSKLDAAAKAAAERLLAGRAPVERSGPGVVLAPLGPRRDGSRVEYAHVTLSVDPARRVAELLLRAPRAAGPTSPAGMREASSELWALRAFRELDDALLDLRFNHPEAGVLLLRTEGDPEHVLASDRALLEAAREDWFSREVVLLIRRTLKRLELSARSLFAVIDQGSCFAGSLLELAVAADRSYMLDAAPGPRLSPSDMNFGPLAGSNGLTRLETRFLADPRRIRALMERRAPLGARDALEAGLVTFTPDELDWDDEVRVAVEERAAFSPDALTGMEANLRFAGPETLETKIFGRLSAWQNWIFQRPNATGERGALKVYGSPERAVFDFRRT